MSAGVGVAAGERVATSRLSGRGLPQQCFEPLPRPALRERREADGEARLGYPVGDVAPQRQRLLPRHLDLQLDQFALFRHVVGEDEAAA